MLLSGATLGLLIANSPISQSYFSLLKLSFSFDLLGVSLDMTILKLINYGLMTLFFFVVGLEIKRELTSGNLAGLRLAAAPLFGALGGMALPAIIYLAIAGSQAPRGWAVPVATDIALAVGVLALIGPRVSDALKSFLLALAVIDDIGAILIIAFIFSTGVLVSWLLAALCAVGAVLLLQKIGARRPILYFMVGLALWYSLYRSGIHPTIAGVIMGLLTPATEVSVKDGGDDGRYVDLEDGHLTLVEKLQGNFHSLSAFIIVPIFAFANSGVKLSSEAFQGAITSPIAWGIIAGLVIGKPVGIFLITSLATRAKIAELPQPARPASIFAVGSTAGIGFTVAIFIAKLAFTEPYLQDLAVTAVIAGSLLSGVISFALFRLIRH